jgi:hypothetical protein
MLIGLKAAKCVSHVEYDGWRYKKKQVRTNLRRYRSTIRYVFNQNTKRHPSLVRRASTS